MGKLSRNELLERMGKENFTACEEALLEHDFRDVFVAEGETYERRPYKKTDENNVRGKFLRELILGNIEGVDIPEDGLKFSSLWVEGELDLLFANISCPITLIACQFEADIDLRQAKLPFLALRHSRLTRLAMDRAEVRGSLNFKNIQVHNELRLAGAQIGGVLNCIGAKFEGSDKSFYADRAEIKGSVFMKNASAKGEVRFLGAQIGGQLNCRGAKFEGNKYSFSADRAEIKGSVFMKNASAKGEVRFNGAQIGGQLDCRGAKFEGELILQKAKIEDGCYFLFKNIGEINANFAQLQEIVDQRESWPKSVNLILNGATYSGFSGGSPNDAKSRLEWLGLINDFQPQPYRQLAKVFRNEGKIRDANEVLYVMEKKLAKEFIDNRSLLENHETGWDWMRERFGILYDFVFKLTTGYGYRLYRALGCIFAISIVIWLLAFASYHWNQMVPNSDVILESQDWAGFSGALDWVDKSPVGRDWQSFNSVAYALDIVVPIIDLHQEEAWSPSTKRGWTGRALWATSWIAKILGWVIATFALASATGFLQSRHSE